MTVFRLRNVLAMVVALFVIGASSQAPVCELACGLPAVGCHAEPRVAAAMELNDGMAMGGDCDHEMNGSGSTVGAVVASCLQEGCGHVAVTVFAKGDAAARFVQAVQWVTTGVVPVDGLKGDGGVSGGRRPPLLMDRAEPLVTNLRV